MKMSKTNPNIETNETSDNITQKQTTKEEQMTLLSSLFIEQVKLFSSLIFKHCPTYL